MQPNIAHHIISMRVKWDETEQKIFARPDDLPADDSDDDQQQPAQGQQLEQPQQPTPQRRAQKEHVLTTAVWIKAGGSRLEPWLTPPKKLARTTAECIWTGLKSSTPMGPWTHFPSTAAAAWILMVFCCDFASSNRRFLSQLEVSSLQLRSGVIVIFSPCMLHILHRAVVPMLGRLLNSLYRAAHVFLVGS